MTDATKLKPCPFCGNTAQWSHRTLYRDDGNDEEQEATWCPNCGISFDGEAGFHLWNTRPVEDALRARIAELEAALKLRKEQLDIARGRLSEKRVSLHEAGKRISTLEDLLSQLANAVNIYRTGETTFAVGKDQADMAEAADRAQTFLHTGEV